MAEKRVFEIDVQTGASGQRVKDVDEKLTSLRSELTKAQAALKDFKAANKSDQSLIEQSATYQQLEGNLKKIRSEYGRLQNDQQGIKSNTTGLTNALKEAAAQIAAGLSAELKKANANLEQFVATQKTATGTVDTQSAEYKELQIEVERLTKDYDVLQAQTKAVDQTTDRFTNALNAAAGDLKAGLTLELNKAQSALQEFLDANKNVGPILKQTAEYQRLEKELEKLNAEYLKLDKAQAGLKSTSADITKAVGNVALKVTAGIAAFQGITSTVGNSIAAFGESEAAQKRLEVALGGTSAALNAQSEALSKKTKFDDDAITGAQALLAQQQLSEEQIQSLIPSILDLAEAQGLDLETATNAVAVSVASGTDKLKRYGVELEGAAGSNERVASAVENLNDKFGQQAEAAALVGTGPLVVFKNNLGNLEEAFGGLIANAIGPFLPSLTEMANGLTSLIEPSESAVDAFHEQDAIVRDLTTNVSPLLDRYDQLAVKTDLTADEQAEMKRVVDTVAKAVPLAVAEFDKYGNALTLNTGKARDFIAANQALAQVKNAEAIEEVSGRLKTLQGDLDKTSKFLNSNRASITLNGLDYIKTAEGIIEVRRAMSDRSVDVERKLDLIEQNKIINTVSGSYASLSKTVGGTKDQLAELKGESTSGELLKQSAAAKEAAANEAALNAALQNQTATLEQLNDKKKALESNKANLKESDTSGLANINAEIAAIEKRIKVFSTESEKKKEAKKTDQQAFNESIKALEDESVKELAVIKSQEDAKTITIQQAESRRLEVARDAATKRLQLTTELASKGGFTVDELANVVALQKNADDAAKVYADFLAKLEQDNAKAENVVAFQFDQINLQSQLEQDLAAFDAFSAAKAQEEEAAGLSHEKRVANQKERDAERLSILQQGNAAVLQSQLDFINAQVAILQRVQASGQPFTEEQSAQLDGLIAQAQELKTAILQATSAPTETTEEQPSFFESLFNLSEEQKQNLIDRAIAFAQQIGAALLDISRQNNAQQLSDTTNRVNSEYGVTVDALKSQQEAGLLTAAEFEARRKKAEDEKNAKLLKAKQKAFKENQKLALAEIAINTAIAVTVALRSGITPVDRAIAVAFAIAAGILQAAVVKQQKPPEFGQGGQLPTTGRVLYGPSHAAGGVPIHDTGGQLMAIAEGGEFIASKAATEKFLPVFQAMNDSVTQRPPVPKVAAFQQDQSRSAINKNTPPMEVRAYVVESDITNTQQRISRFDRKAEIG